ncbi:Internalin-J precursor [Porphyromonas crevioricanis]|uniref:Internalin-J n=1 Tax=Porphyromonas crevioricanis TaxID=393921 RepID=A0A2X4PMP8_9PORP|nr:hypothetical protein [Porphyromonas crevioricanis]GAD06595.1 hypothetical protein PORCAN_193 [Porphyromonas crevioricanis JCM 13913]SQH72818.1 Internalin-J precursor [Porphyromonas crevioricanis]
MRALLLIAGLGACLSSSILKANALTDMEMEEPKAQKVKITSGLSEGEDLVISAMAEEDSTPWIDLNGNGKMDEGEEIINDPWTTTSLKWGDKSEVVIYGKNLQALNLCNAKLKTVDLREGGSLETLELAGNELEELDVTALKDLKSLNVSQNRIGAEAMHKMIVSLCNGYLCQLMVINTSSEVEEYNVCLKSDVEAAKMKGWSVMDAKDGMDYPGSEQNVPAQGGRKILLITGLKKGEDFKIHLVAAEGTTPWIDLNANETQDEGEGLPAQEPGQFVTVKWGEKAEAVIHAEGPKVLMIKAAKLQSIGLKDAITLEMIDLSNNELEALDCSELPGLSSINVSQNKITAEEMSKLIKSLNSSEISAKNITVINTAPEQADCEHNVCLKADVEAAVAKKWQVLDAATGMDYPGKEITPEPEVPDEVQTITFSSELMHGAPFKLILKSDATEYSPWIDLNGNGKDDMGEYLFADGMTPVSLTWGEKSQAVIYAKDISGLVLKNARVKTIDLSKAPLLEELDLSSNRITSIDLSSQTLIRSLDLSDNKLTSLSIDPLEKLVRIDCCNNPIGSLDVSKARDLEDLFANACMLKELNLSTHSKLKSVVLKKNRLEKLDLSAAVELVSLDVAENELKEQDMHNLISSLSAEGTGKYLVVINTSEKAQETERNVCLKADVELAMQKGWIVLDDKDSKAFPGSDVIGVVYPLQSEFAIHALADGWKVFFGDEIKHSVALYDFAGRCLYSVTGHYEIFLPQVGDLLLVRIDNKVIKLIR